MRRLLWCTVCVLTFGIVAAVCGQSLTSPLNLVRVTPAGEEVPAERQVVFEFDRPVAPLGRMERRADEIPIAITPALACAWRWLTPTTLACQLGEQQALTLATRYTVTVQPGLLAQDGTTLAAPVSHTFVTTRPKVTSFWWRSWTTPGTPHLVVSLDQVVTSASLAQHVYLQTAQKKRVALNVTAEKDGKGRVWIVSPVTALPLDTKITLHVEPGLVATAGPEAGTEQRIITDFATFPPLRFLGVRCLQSNGDPIVIAPTAKTPPAQRCDSLREVALKFSAPVVKEAVKDVVQMTPALPRRPNYDPWEDVASWSRLAQGHQQGNVYEVNLPSPPLQAYTAYRVQAPAARIKDEFGRLLPEAITVPFATAHRLPTYHLSHPMSVLEQQVDAQVPIVVTNLQKLQLRYETLTPQGRQAPQERVVPLYKVRNLAYAFPLPMREMLAAPSGALQGTVKTTPEVGEPRWFFSQVTPFHVHVKIGHYNSLAWVTRFDTGHPVAGVQVQIYADTLGTFAPQPTILTQAISNADGIATLDGTSKLDPELKRLEGAGDKAPRLFVRLQKDQEFALVPLLDDLLVEVSGTNDTYIETSMEHRYQHIRTWGSTPQGVYRAGDTVQFKFYVRDQDNQRLVPAPRTGYALRIVDPAGKTVHTVKDVRLSEFGAYAGEFAVPRNAAVGWYRFLLSAAFARAGAPPAEPESVEEDSGPNRWEPMRVLISDFTPASFRVTADLHGTSFGIGDQVQFTIQAKLHAGGPYGTAPARLTATVYGQPLIPESAQATGFYFAVSESAGKDPVPPEKSRGTEAPGSADNDDDDDAFLETVERDNETVWQREEILHDDGTLQAAFAMPTVRVLYGKIEVESAVRDERGKYVAGRTSGRYTGRDRYVGLYQPDWTLQAGTVTQVKTLVVDAQGTAVAGTNVRIEVAQLHTTAAQVKSAGNAYVPQYTHTWKEVTTCTLVSTAAPEECRFTPATSGSYKITARITDTKGRVHRTSLRRWAVGAGQVLWEQTPNYTLSIFPEKPTYQVGDTARYLIQNPFPGARALVTIERFGVQRSWLEIFTTSTAVIEFPIKPEHIPGFYLSVVVMAPRVDKPLLNNVDLGKPAFRMGYVQVPVRDPYKELQVEVKPQQPVYKPRQTASVEIVTRTRQGEVPPLELAVAVLDESVFDLITRGKDYFDPYKGFYHLEPLDLRNYNLLTQLVGRQKFEKKGATHGGDGGLDLDLRSVLKYVSYWNPALRPDAAGKATITFELPDNLTGWRVLAMAVTPEDRMGLGEGHFQTNKPTEIRPALPNHVMAGDRFDASFTVMNRTDTTRTLAVTLSASGPVQPEATLQQPIEAEPYKRYHVRLPVHTTGAGDIRLRVQAGDEHDRDALELPVTVRQRQIMEVAATYGTLITDEAREAIAFPPDIRTDIGHLSVTATPTIMGNLAGAFQYMRDYPYECWEQVLTKGVAAAHYRSLMAYLPDSVSWPESTDLPAQTLARAANHQAPNGGMTYYVPKDDYVSPDLSAYTALAFNWLRASGAAIPTPMEGRLHDYLLTFLRQNKGPDFYTGGMNATVRAMILAALGPHNKAPREEVLRLQTQVQTMGLFGKAYYLLALAQLPGTTTQQSAVLNAIRAHANETSGKLVFSEQVDGASRRLLDSSARTNCAVLSALIAAGAQAGQNSEAPFKLVRAITEDRQRRDRWESTQENIFCMQALVDFSRAFEQTNPDFTLRALLDGLPFGEAQFQDIKSAAVEMQRPLQAADVGRQAILTLHRQGQGRLYYTTRLAYSPKELPDKPSQAGMELQREYSVERGRGWLLLQSPMQVQAGELLKVDLYLSVPAARHFVVVDDPVPGGLEPVNRDLATASTIDAAKATIPFAHGSWWFRHKDWHGFGTSRWSFYHKELRHQAARFYSEYLPAGRYHLSYVAQAIAAGEFVVLPSHAEEMYHPETFGRSAPAQLRVVLPGASEARR